MAAFDGSAIFSHRMNVVLGRCSKADIKGCSELHERYAYTILVN